MADPVGGAARGAATAARLLVLAALAVLPFQFELLRPERYAFGLEAPLLAAAGACLLAASLLPSGRRTPGHAGLRLSPAAARAGALLAGALVWTAFEAVRATDGQLAAWRMATLACGAVAFGVVCALRAWDGAAGAQTLRPPAEGHPWALGDRIERVLLLGGLLTGILATVEHYVMSTPESWARSAAGLANANSLSAYLVALLPLAIARQYDPREREGLARVFWWLTTTAILTGIVLSATRMGWLVAIAVALGFALCVDRRVLLWAGLYALAYAAIFPEVIIGRGGGTLSEEDASGWSRPYLWAIALAMWRGQPLIGHGLGYFTTHMAAYAAHVPPAIRAVMPPFPHNTFLYELAEQGLVGAVLVFAPAALLLVRPAWLRCPLGAAVRGALSRRPAWRVQSGPDLLAFARWVGLVAVLAHGLTNSTLQVRPVGVAFWVLAALYALDERSPVASSDSSARRTSLQ